MKDGVKNEVKDEFRLLMIGAMYENGGNTTHRFLDGHRELFVYPFESQLGTTLVQDRLTSTFPVKYRWPVFALDATPFHDYKAIIDEECKVRTRTPLVSKFRDHEFDLSDDERCELYCREIHERGRSRANNVAAFFRATFQGWRKRNSSGEERVYVGYSPIITVDAERILQEVPGAHFLHIVRNPWSAYADTKKRPVPLSLADYLLGWTINQYYALMVKERFPDRFHLVRTEDLFANPEGVLGAVCKAMGLSSSSTLSVPTWNGEPLKEVYPWGTIRRATTEANKQTAKELSPAEHDEIRLRAAPYLDSLDYRRFLSGA